MSDSQLDERVVGPLAGNTLLHLARLNPGQGIWKTYNDLSATYVFDGPEIVDVAYPKVIVRQAYYDKAKDTLAIGLTPGSDDRGKIAFKVKNLKKGGVYEVMVDGRPAAKLAGGRIQAEDGDLTLQWTKAGELAVGLTLGEGKSILIQRPVSRQVASR